MSLGDVEAKLAITEVLHRYARAMDRMDAPMVLSCWHPAGTDDHAPLYSGSATGFVEWLWPVHAAFDVTRHCISNVLIELDGDRAGSECYWQVTLRKAVGDDLWDSISQGRYVDTFEKIGGVWAIRHRQSLLDWNQTGKVLYRRGDPGTPTLVEPFSPGSAPPPNRRSADDYSYSVLKRRF